MMSVIEIFRQLDSLERLCYFLKPAPHLQAILFVLVVEGFFQLRLLDRNHCPVNVRNREGEKNDWPDLFL